MNKTIIVQCKREIKGLERQIKVLEKIIGLGAAAPHKPRRKRRTKAEMAAQEETPKKKRGRPLKANKETKEFKFEECPPKKRRQPKLKEEEVEEEEEEEEKEEEEMEAEAEAEGD